MKHAASEAFCVFALLVSLAVPSAVASDSQHLYDEFVNPPRDFSPMPFWFWNGKMEGPVIQQEIRDMVSQHVYGAFLHGRDGLETPYFSEGWFKAFGAGLEQSKRSGFEFNFVDEYDWPSGELRNVWMAGNHQSEVLARRPDFRMRTLAYEAKVVTGPRQEELTPDRDLQAVVAARWLGDGRIDEESLTLIDGNAANKKAAWSVPEGQWVILKFSLKDAMGFDGGFVDLMNPDETSLFFHLVYDEYYRRFAPYFGSTIHYSFSDHEGDYGYRIAWTPKLFEAFQNRTGYDLRKVLPLLIYQGGERTTKVRNDYLATVTDLYRQSFWQGITSSAAKLGIGRSGHAWEESLQWSAALQGSLFAVERGLNPVGVDSLFDFGRQPLNFKVAQSVADFEGRRFACENQGVQGTDSYLDLEGIRRGTNGIAASGVNLFIPHAFDYDAGRANYPPDWLHQPYWPYFHYYADYTRRVSYMNADSHHVTNVLLYYPITTIWADTGPLFSGGADYQSIGKPEAWKNQTILINDYYTRIILELSAHQWDYNIADDQYLSDAKVEGNELVIGPQRFRAIILPPITTLSRKTLAKIAEFHRAGGVIFGIRLLPTASPEAGGNDSAIKKGIQSIFGADVSVQQAAENRTSDPSPVHSFYIQSSVDELIAELDAHVPKDVTVVSGPAQHLIFQHRSKSGLDYYWVVNDTERRRTNEIHFSISGKPEKWNALTGKIEPLFYTNTPDGTDVRLVLDPWDAFYVVFHADDKAKQDLRLQSTNADEIDSVSQDAGGLRVHVTGPSGKSAITAVLSDSTQTYRGEVPGDSIEPLTLGSGWQFKPAEDRLPVPYARTGFAPEEEGTRRGWRRPGFDDTDWPDVWLNDTQTTIRNWKVIGPFPNHDNNGFGTAYPPESDFNANARYDGEGRQVGWDEYNGNEPHLALRGWNLWMETEGGRLSDSGYVVNLDQSLLTDSTPWVVSYAHTYLYSSREQHAQFVLAADNWAAVWLNHKQVFAQLRTPFWYELNDNWADRIEVNLEKGWNEVLVKIGKGRGTSSGFYGFSFRVADESGQPLPDIMASTSADAAVEASPSSNEAAQWYRVDVPPGCVAVMPPKLHKSYQMFLNGEELHGMSDAPIALDRRLSDSRNVLVIVAQQRDPLISPLEFVTGATEVTPRSWMKMGLANFSGTAVYTKTFNLPETFRGKHVVLDLGRVSSVADVYVNDAPAGTLVWSPYRVDITKLLKPGENELRIVVTNTEANRRAVGTWRHILGQIDLDGMEGPVRLIPYVDETLTLQPTRSTGETAPTAR